MLLELVSLLLDEAPWSRASHWPTLSSVEGNAGGVKEAVTFWYER